LLKLSSSLISAHYLSIEESKVQHIVGYSTTAVRIAKEKQSIYVIQKRFLKLQNLLTIYEINNCCRFVRMVADVT